MQVKLVTKKTDNKKAENFAHKEWKRFNGELAYGWNTKKYIFAAYQDKKVVGFASLKINGGAAYLSQLIVSKSMRNKGIGDILLRKFEALAKSKKCHIAYLETSEKHKEALSFYKKHGYSVIAKMNNNKFHLTWYFLGKNI
jgi:ribosomal protein S18 acetylase RimI-like enzyme